MGLGTLKAFIYFQARQFNLEVQHEMIFVDKRVEWNIMKWRGIRIIVIAMFMCSSLTNKSAFIRSAYHIVSYRIISYRIVSYRIVSYRIVSYRIVEADTIRYDTPSQDTI